ncbi:hypothetical protein MRX96_029136 [Rhipicephalus microplus]
MGSNRSSRSASLSLSHGTGWSCSPCSGAIEGICWDEEEVTADDSIGSPPVVDDPVTDRRFSDVNLDNKSDHDMIERLIKGEKLFQPESLTALSPFDVEAVSRDADRIIKRVGRKRPFLEASGSAFRRRLRRLSKSYASFLGTSMSPSALSTAQQSRRDSVGSKSRGSGRSTSSFPTPKLSKSAAKKRPGRKSSDKGGDKGVGNVSRSGKTKTKNAKEEKGRQRDKNRPTVEDKSVETVEAPRPRSPCISTRLRCAVYASRISTKATLASLPALHTVTIRSTISLLKMLLRRLRRQVMAKVSSERQVLS